MYGINLNLYEAGKLDFITHPEFESKQQAFPIGFLPTSSKSKRF